MRAPWRVLFFLGAVLAAFTVVQTVLYPPVALVLQLAGLRFGASNLMLAAALLLAHWASLRWIDGQEWSTVGLGRAAVAPRRIAVGLTTGALAIAVPSLVLLAAGWLRVEPVADGSWWASAAGAAAFLLPAALWEELLFRGYAFRAIADAAGVLVALSVSSLLFGVVHLSNDGASAQSTALVTIAGFFLGAVLLVTRSLYAAWAAHWAWNWTMAAVFHVAVSGTGFATPGYRVSNAGPDWATGGTWGPEGGIAAAAGMFGAMYLLLGSRRGRRVPDDQADTARAATPRRVTEA